jgi:hypothetical protein
LDTRAPEYGIKLQLNNSSEDDTILDRTNPENCPEYDRMFDSRTTECRQEDRRIWDRFIPEYWSGGWQDIRQEDGKMLDSWTGEYWISEYCKGTNIDKSEAENCTCGLFLTCRGEKYR